MKKVKHLPDSSFMFSTARCMESAPWPPRRANPGPNMEHKAAIVMHRIPNAIPQVVVLR